jgi:cell division protein FtsB
LEKIAKLEQTLKDRERQLLDQSGKAKELSVNLHMEQESLSKLKSEKDKLEREVKDLREEIAILK